MSEFIGDWAGTPPGLTGLDAFQSGSDDRDFVHLLLLGKPAPVTRTIHDLYTCRFCEVHVWSRPLPPPAQGTIVLHGDEVMRVYKRYLTRG